MIYTAKNRYTILTNNYIGIIWNKSCKLVISTALSSDEEIKYMNKLIDLMDDDDDVQNVYHNWEEVE